MPAISVIVPIYNVELYINKCIESILHQSFNDFELLLIDDGSMDLTGVIINEFINDERIRIIHKKNGGVSSARNIGIEYAQGNYIYFCDADDYLRQDCLETLFLKISFDNSDCVIMNYYLRNNCSSDLVEHELKDEFIDISNTQFSFIIRHVLQGNTSPALWIRIFKSSIIKQNSIRMCETSENYAEDLGFVMVYTLFCSRITTIKYAGYYYLQRESSLSHMDGSDIRMNAINEISRYFYGYIIKEIKRENVQLIYNIHFLLFYPQLIRILSNNLTREVPYECKKIKKKNWFNILTARSIIYSNTTVLNLEKNSIFEYKNLLLYTIHKNYKMYCILNGILYKFIH